MFALIYVTYMGPHDCPIHSCFLEFLERQAFIDPTLHFLFMTSGVCHLRIFHLWDLLRLLSHACGVQKQIRE